ncbi:MAG TPA: thermonuclease family protein [Candidatus Paceibacterota bacterium]
MFRKYLLQLLALGLVALLAVLGYDVSLVEEDVPSDAKWYPLVRVIDGDTFISLIDGEEVRVRLIGIDTPETVDPREPAQCFGAEATVAAINILEGQLVRLETDPSQDTYDAYGRLLAYAYVPASPVRSDIMVNEYLIREGFGHEYTLSVPYRYQQRFREAQAEARARERGLWADGACASG